MAKPHNRTLTQPGGISREAAARLGLSPTDLAEYCDRLLCTLEETLAADPNTVEDREVVCWLGRVLSSHFHP